jgi:hypothetical protein
MRAAVRGEPTDRLPWAPRLDLWYNARRRAGTLPPKYRNASLAQITDDLGWGFHAIVPHFKDVRGVEDDMHRALGVYNLRTMPYATVFENVGVSCRCEGNKTVVTYDTPHGNVRTRTLYDASMRAAGVSITHVTEYAIKSHRDYAAVGHLFEHARVEPNDAGWAEFRDGVGDRGLAAGFVSLAGSPMHLLQRELMHPQLFFYEMYDHPAELADCAAKISGYFERVFQVCAAGPADLFLLGANYDARMTYPPFFEEHIAPWLRTFARTLHARGKLLLTHTDGENDGLLDLYVASEIDIADSVCPKPMTTLTLREVRDRFDGRISIMGGVPSVCLLEDSMPDAEFDAFLDGFFDELGAGDHLILGVSDTTPPAADVERLVRIGSRAREFGPIRPTQAGPSPSAGPATGRSRRGR